MNMDHPGVQKGIEFFETFLKLAANGSKSVPCPELIARLYDAAVRPLDLLIEMAALWLLNDQTRGLVKSDLHLYHLMGSKLIRFIRYDGSDKRHPAFCLWLPIPELISLKTSAIPP
jgi:hypothetical protein